MLNFVFGDSSARTENGIKTIESNSVLHIRGLVGIVMTYVKKSGNNSLQSLHSKP